MLPLKSEVCDLRIHLTTKKYSTPPHTPWQSSTSEQCLASFTAVRSHVRENSEVQDLLQKCGFQGALSKKQKSFRIQSCFLILRKQFSITLELANPAQARPERPPSQPHPDPPLFCGWWYCSCQFQTSASFRWKWTGKPESSLSTCLWEGSLACAALKAAFSLSAMATDHKA